MNDDDKKRFSKIMLGMADNFRDTITHEGLQMRFEMLRGFSIGKIEQAALEILARRKYTKMPPVAEFIEVLGAAAPKTESIAIVEADKIIEHLHKKGSAVLPEIEDPITRQLMRTRWPYRRWAAKVTDSELNWWVKDFREAYIAEASAGINQALIVRTPEFVQRLLKGIGN